jgi:hypothetical protein
LKELGNTSFVLSGSLLVGVCLGASTRLRRLPSKMSYWLGRVAQEIKEIAFSDMRRDKHVILFQGFDGLDS